MIIVQLHKVTDTWEYTVDRALGYARLDMVNMELDLGINFTKSDLIDKAGRALALAHPEIEQDYDYHEYVEREADFWVGLDRKFKIED